MARTRNLSRPACGSALAVIAAIGAALPAPPPVLARPPAAPPRPASGPGQPPAVAAVATAAPPGPTLTADGAIRLDAPVTAATVYSDRARVARSARLTLTGAQSRLRFPPLCGRVDPASLRVDVQGYAAAGRPAAVDVARIEIDRPLIGDLAQSTATLPLAEVRRLVGAIEAIDDETARLAEDSRSIRGHVDLLMRLSPAVPPIPSNSGRGTPLNPAGWADSLAFVRARQASLDERSQAIEDRRHELARTRAKLIEEVRKLSGSPALASPRRCYEVTATLTGHGLVDVWLTYMTHGARWQPSYDVVLLPDRGLVDLAFAGQVSQDSGEDWQDVQLTLSTAIPTQATQLPKLLSWKLGARERFIPTPAPVYDQPAPAPRSVPPLAQVSPEAQWRSRLLRLIGSASPPTGGPLGGPTGATGLAVMGGADVPDRDHDGIPDSEDVVSEAKKAEDAKDARLDDDSPKPVMPVPPPAPPPPPAPEEPAPVLEAKPRPHRAAPSSRVTQEVSRSYEATTSLAPGAYSMDFGGETVEGSLMRPQAQVLGVGLAPPPGYRAPSLPANSAAARAGGYDLRYVSLYRESLRSGGGSRRVALFSHRFPVSLLRKVYAALAPDAYLVAVIKNPLGDRGEPLPGGQARLFVGSDPAGQAELQLVAPGERFTLPLGIDRAIKPIRNVHMTTEEKGVFSKDEITQYVVKIELANPYATPVDVLLVDQLPLPGDKNVELKLLSMNPPASPPSTPPPPGTAPSPYGPNIDAASGAFEWRLTLPPRGKVETQFTYSLRRPKGARLYQ